MGFFLEGEGEGFGVCGEEGGVEEEVFSHTILDPFVALGGGLVGGFGWDTCLF